MAIKQSYRSLVRLTTAIFMLFICIKSIKAQCPDQIICDATRGLGLKYTTLPTNINPLNTYLDFGSTDNRNGYYNGTIFANDPDLEIRKIVFYTVDCSSGLSNLKITFNDANRTYCGPNVDCYNYVFYDNGNFFKRILDPYFASSPPSGCKEWEGDCGTNGTVYRTGAVSIGTTYTNPKYLLAVSGKILTEQYKVQKCGNVWCDYVFDKSYKLMPLRELEAYIQQNKRLPNTKSADEIKKEEGLDAAEILLNHQEKIEEIFLHLIDLDKHLNTLESKTKND